MDFIFKVKINPTSSVLSVLYEKLVILYLQMFIQHDTRVVNITVGDDFRGLCDQKRSYQRFECLWCWSHCCELFFVYDGTVVPYTTLNKLSLCYRKVIDVHKFQAYPCASQAC